MKVGDLLSTEPPDQQEAQPGDLVVYELLGLPRLAVVIDVHKDFLYNINARPTATVLWQHGTVGSAWISSLRVVRRAMEETV